MEKNYDVIIIGAGPGGIFCAYELLEKNKDLKVLMVEKGRPIEKRTCPKRKTKVCVGCKPCSITTGFAGAGAFSDGKLSLSPDVGGNLPEILGANSMAAGRFTVSGRKRRRKCQRGVLCGIYDRFVGV